MKTIGAYLHKLCSHRYKAKSHWKIRDTLFLKYFTDWKSDCQYSHTISRDCFVKKKKSTKKMQQTSNINSVQMCYPKKGASLSSVEKAKRLCCIHSKFEFFLTCLQVSKSGLNAADTKPEIAVTKQKNKKWNCNYRSWKVEHSVYKSTFLTEGMTNI